MNTCFCKIDFFQHLFWIKENLSTEHDIIFTAMLYSLGYDICTYHVQKTYEICLAINYF